MSFEDFADERAWGLRPPGLPSSCAKPGWPGPPLGWWGFPPRNPNRDVVYFREAIEDIIKDMIRRGELQPGPNAPGQVKPQPQIGVTDGSSAATGMVGEVLDNISTVSFPASGPGQSVTTTITGIVLPPGDWDMWGYAAASGQAGFIVISISPSPPGTFGNMALQVGQYVPGGSTESLTPVFPTTMAVGRYAVPTLIPMVVYIDSGVAAPGTFPAGTLTVRILARRMR